MRRAVQVASVITTLVIFNGIVPSANATLIETANATPNPHTNGDTVRITTAAHWDAYGCDDGVVADAVKIEISGSNGYYDWDQVDAYPWITSHTFNLYDGGAGNTYAEVSYDITVRTHYTDYEGLCGLGEDGWDDGATATAR